MRLLSTSKFRTVEFHGGDVPPYAILSHCWGQGEILLDDIQSLASLDCGWDSLHVAKKGYDKLRKSVRLARTSGFQYIWVDTCCIDKTSSAELSEAINSMYRWYQNAVVCYAYLADAYPARTEKIAARGSTFRRSRWFTRGWTLQELIAPKRVDFLASNWSYLGSKTDNEFLDLLSDITQIRQDVLTHEVPLSQISVASRMCWAANRSTTRIEDIAYSLLGIFDVNMPLLYGEGTNAFIRLQEAVLVKHDDQSLFAWKQDDVANDADEVIGYDPASRLSGLLADSPARFDGVGNLETSLRLTFAGSPSAVTSKGVQVDLFLHPCIDIKGADMFAVLSCEQFIASTGQRRAPIIYLKRLWGIGDQFARVRTDLLTDIDLDTLGLDSGSYQSVFIKQDPGTDLCLVKITLATGRQGQAPPPNIATYGESLPLALQGTYPEGHDNDTGSLEISDFKLGHPAAVFEVSMLGGGFKDTVYVAVGLQVRNKRSIRSWCEIITLDRQGVEWRTGQTYLEAVFRYKTKQSMSQSTSYGEISVAESRKTNAMVCATVTERNRGRNLEILLHVLLDSSTLKNQSAPLMRPLAFILETGYSDLEVVPPEELTAVTPTTVVQPSQQLFPSRWQQEVEALLADFSVTDSLELSVFQTEGLRRRIRISSIRDLFGQGTSISLLLKYCRDVLPSLDDTSRNVAQVIGTNDLAVTLTYLRNERKTEEKPDEILKFRPIHWAIVEENLPALRYLLLYGADPLGSSSTRLTTLHLAALAGNVEVLQVLQPLLDRKFRSEDNPEAEIDAYLEPTISLNEYPLHFAAAYATDEGFWTPSNFSILSPRMRDPFTENSLGETPLHRAAAMGNLAAVGNLLAHSQTDQAKINHPDVLGRTALWHAVCNGEASLKIVETLLRSGADPNIADDNGLTPVHVACRFGNTAALRLMEVTQAETKLHLPAGSTNLLPSQIASIFGHLSCLALLLNAKAPVTSTPLERVVFEALYFAIANGHQRCARLIWLRERRQYEGRCLCIVMEPSGPVLRAVQIKVDEVGWSTGTGKNLTEQKWDETSLDARS
ncbi:hypothetical protein B0T24DRAFT_561203 [Lasiosphaeria ovina]|uniref:Heterokaryon incompatibility domain-containing protein n=1 Tax=Lasiosphaeria ovina TaxID=92902 RepID=A0AAE0JWN6_9PEZI|nr:hypothetical protein B0T24DRAFT_561203 [Lasiosphaeria ovina]